MKPEPPPILTLTEELLDWTLARTASLPKSQRFTFGQRLDGLSLGALEYCVTARYATRETRKSHLMDLNLVLEKLRVFWRIVQRRGWISERQLLFVAGNLDEIGRMAGGWMKAEDRRIP